MRGTGREGAAIAAVLLILLAMQVLAHGVLLAALQELSATRAAVYLVQARAAAEGAVRQVVGEPFDPGLDSLARGDALMIHEGRVGRARFTVGAERLSRETWLMRGRGEVDGWAGSVSTARLRWVLSPAERVAAFQAVAHVGVLEAGPPTGSIVTTVLPESPASAPACAPWFAVLDSLMAGRTLAQLVADTTDALRLGLLDRAFLLDRASPVPGDSVTPIPTISRGRCDVASPNNWGDPRPPPARCADRFVFRGRHGDLRLVGGIGQGLLLVTGDLSLEAGTDFRGLVLVGGAIRLSGGSRLYGFARAGGAVQSDSTSQVVGSACWAVRSIGAVEDELRVPIAYPGWGWLAVR
jgi:hypothetical protein